MHTNTIWTTTLLVVKLHHTYIQLNNVVVQTVSLQRTLHDILCVYVPRKLGICAISRLRCAFSESFIGGKTAPYVHTTMNVVMQTVCVQHTLHDILCAYIIWF